MQSYWYDFLSDVENMNDSHIKVQYSTSKLGWIQNDFIPYDTEIVFDGDQRFRQTYDSVSERGNWKIWQSHMQKLRKSGRLEMKIYDGCILLRVFWLVSWEDYRLS